MYPPPCKTCSKVYFKPVVEDGKVWLECTKCHEREEFDPLALAVEQDRQGKMELSTP